MMRLRSWVRAAIAGALVPPLLILGPAGTGYAQERPNLTAKQVAPDGRVSATKSITSQLARTDPALLNRHDATPVSIVVKLDYDSVSTYRGGVAGFAPTSPSATGKPLSGSANERRYESHIAD